MTILSNRNLDGPPRHRSNTDDKRDIESASGKNERSKEELNVGEKQHVGMGMYTCLSSSSYGHYHCFFIAHKHRDRYSNQTIHQCCRCQSMRG